VRSDPVGPRFFTHENLIDQRFAQSHCTHAPSAPIGCVVHHYRFSPEVGRLQGAAEARGASAFSRRAVMQKSECVRRGGTPSSFLRPPLITSSREDASGRRLYLFHALFFLTELASRSRMLFEGAHQRAGDQEAGQFSSQAKKRMLPAAIGAGHCNNRRARGWPG